MTAYVYAIIVNGVVRYIGKGSGIPMKRAREHIRTAKRLNRRREAGEVLWASNLYNRLAKALKNGRAVEAVCIVDNLTDEQAFDRERTEIEKASGLWNLDGGGLGGKEMSAEHRAKLSAAAKRRWQRPGEIEKLHAFANSPENIARLKAGNAELARRPDIRAKNAKAAKERWLDPTRAKRMLVGLKRGRQTRWNPKHQDQFEFFAVAPQTMRTWSRNLSWNGPCGNSRAGRSILSG